MQSLIVLDLQYQNAIRWFTAQHKSHYGAETVSALGQLARHLLVDYPLTQLLIKRSRIVRDSPVKCFVDAKLPENLLHDYYIAIVMGYYESESTPFMQGNLSWAELIAKLHHLYKIIEKPLTMPLLVESSLNTCALRTQLKATCSRYLQHRLAKPALVEIRDIFYRDALSLFESAEGDIIIAPGFERYNISALHVALEEDIPELTDPDRLSDEMLREKCAALDKNGRDIFMVDAYSDLPAGLKAFDQTCIMINALGLKTNLVPLMQRIFQAKLTMPSDWIDTMSDMSVLEETIRWVRTIILPWLSFVWQKEEMEESDWYSFLRTKIRTEQIVYNYFLETRLGYIFDIILEFPASAPIIRDIKTAIDKVSHMNTNQEALLRLKDTVLKEFKERLLKLSVWPTSILHQTTLCVQSLKLIDPTCAILVPILNAVRVYLRMKRNDVPPAVVDMIREADTDSLAEGPSYTFKDGELDGKDEIYERERIERMSADMIAILISMCGSTTDFVEAYQERLARELLSTVDYNTDEEVVRLELLKRRFPENTLVACDVMIKDIAESKRLDRQLHIADPNAPDQFHSIIMSRHYWPERDTTDDDQMMLWTGLLESMEYIERQYQIHKANRKLHWTPTQGSVTIELEFRSGIREFTVDPVKALVISVFQREGT
ncbi:hypothetical protein BX666DRAFT_2030826 [Dichotomocladium elegans]|nr:hypothetical protein BX666DRAFT_2030826 [Dichotomocladium elegans]